MTFLSSNKNRKFVFAFEAGSQSRSGKPGRAVQTWNRRLASESGQMMSLDGENCGLMLRLVSTC